MKIREKPKAEKPEPVSSPMIAHASSAASQNVRNIGLIIGREYKARVQKKGFIIGTIFLIVLIIAAAFLPTLIELLSSSSQSKIAVINEGGQIAGQDITSYLDTRLNTGIDGVKKADFEITTVPLGQIEASRQKVRDGKLDGLLEVRRGPNGDLDFSFFTKNNATGTSALQMRSVVTEINFTDKIGRLGIPQNQIATLFAQPQFQVTSTAQERNGRSDAENLAAYFVALAGVVLIFTTILQYGSTVAQGAVEEKSSRVMEIMINAATPFQLLMGKIIGIGLAGFTQVGLMVAVGIGAFLAQSPIKSALLGKATVNTNINITGLSLSLLGLVLLYFILGFLLYATLFGAVGSLVSRQEDVQSALAPLTFLFTGGYLASVGALNAPEAGWVVGLSYIPFFSPMLMLARAGLGNLEWWEVVMTTGLMIISIIFFTWVAARIYRAGVLMYGQRPGFVKLVKLVISG